MITTRITNYIIDVDYIIMENPRYAISTLKSRGEVHALLGHRNEIIGEKSLIKSAIRIQRKRLIDLLTKGN